MNTSNLIPVLASSGDSGYLYGLFFLIVALVIGAATRHFLQRIPLPFTVLLLLIGLAMGGLNRAYGPHGGILTVRIIYLCMPMDCGINLSIH